jgi:hypothetical protein
MQLPKTKKGDDRRNDIVFEFRIKLPDLLPETMEKYLREIAKVTEEVIKAGSSLIGTRTENVEKLKKVQIK